MELKYNKTILEEQEAHADAYLKHLRELGRTDPEAAKIFATKELIEMGLLNADGSTKDIIVSWD